MTQRHPIQNNIQMLITIVTADRKNYFEDHAYAREAIETLYRVQQYHPFFLYGFVIMPDHVHFLMLVTAPGTISRIMNVYKSGVSFNTGIHSLWQRRFYISMAKNPRGALHYIHANPVKKGMVRQPRDYPWSSASGEWPVSALTTIPVCP